MSSAFPIPVPTRLPTSIEPCPIVEAILELRFVTAESWRTLPGLLFGHIRDRYPEQKDLPLAQMPEEIRRREPAFTHQPLVQFYGADFLIQFGPRVVSLVSKPNRYPGWAEVEQEMTWLLQQLERSGFISEGERLGTRYINFFSFDIFEKLHLGVTAGQKTLSGTELSLSTVFRKPPFTARLHAANRAILGSGDNAHVGSILDIDVWLGSLDFEIFKNALTKFGEAHRLEKEIFFGLLKPDFLSTLNPTYE